jgi:hypothetical protein
MIGDTGTVSPTRRPRMRERIRHLRRSRIGAQAELSRAQPWLRAVRQMRLHGRTPSGERLPGRRLDGPVGQLAFVMPQDRLHPLPDWGPRKVLGRVISEYDRAA